MEDNPNSNVFQGAEARVPDIANSVTQPSHTELENVESRRMFEDLFDNSDAAIIDYDFSPFSLIPWWPNRSRHGRLNGRVNTSYGQMPPERKATDVGMRCRTGS
jgi:hypothetical protein